MKRIFIILPFLLAAIFPGCKEEKPYQDLPGHYHSHSNWNGNDINIKLGNDSVFTFTAFANRGVTFCAAGTWNMRDSFLMLNSYDTTVPISMDKHFPELKGLKNVVAIQMQGKFVVRKDKIFNLDKDGKANEGEYYDKVK
jgi:hypothetical protein